MSKKIIAGNWKQNGTLKSSISLTKKVLQAVKKEKYTHEIVIIPPSIFLLPVKDLIHKSKIKLGAQNVSAFNDGAYTGEISGSMLKDSGVDYCLVGHSERRHIINEDESDFSSKVSRLIDNDIKVIYCFGETLNDYKNKKTKLIIKRQLKKLFLNNKNNLKKHPSKLILAYEPVWAIGTGLVPSPEELVSIFKYIRDTVNNLDKKYASIKLLYGGSVTPDNASSLMDTEHIDGLLIGGASLIAKKFIDICSTI
ncbi:MAG: triosephosphate isomerase [Ectothiorhodospiraceae bacterium]|nr:MAG: triosephosphate isomerase [Ectothiorhodospiraceae bacterium]